MKDRELYTQLLGLHSPWVVVGVELDSVKQEVLVRVNYDASEGLLSCAHCGSCGSVYDYREERRWRHLDSCGFTTWLVARVPRVSCSKCGVQTAEVPWSAPHSRFTLGFECFALSVLQACGVQSKAAALLRLSKGQVHDVMERAVQRGLQRRAQAPRSTLPFLSLDEKSIQAGHNYLTVLGDTQGGCVLDVAEGRTKEAAGTLLKGALSESQRATVRAVSMDMWKGFAGACHEVLPQAQIVHDRFHITQYLNRAVDITRRCEHRRLTRQSKAGKSAEKAADSPLNKTKYVWLKNEDNLTDKQRLTLQALREGDLETVKVWSFKEAFRAFFACADEKQGAAFFEQWCQDALALGNAALNHVVRLLQAHREGLLAYLRFGITNGGAEGINSRIQQIKFNARGFRKPGNFRIAILFFLAKLDLYPQKTQ